MVVVGHGYRREVFGLFVLQGRHLGQELHKSVLETAILAGPPREMYEDNLEADRWHYLVAHSVWLCLAKLRGAGLFSREFWVTRLTEISTAYPKWQLATNERDEFLTG